MWTFLLLLPPSDKYNIQPIHVTLMSRQSNQKSVVMSDLFIHNFRTSLEIPNVRFSRLFTLYGNVAA